MATIPTAQDAGLNTAQIANIGNGNSPTQSTPAVSATPTSISSASLSPTPSLNYSQPSPTLTPDTSGLQDALNKTYQETPQEQQQSNVNSRLQDINTLLAGKSAFQTEQAQNYGLSATTDASGNISYQDPALNDLNSTLTTLTNQAKTIPLQIQNDYTGRGATEAGVSPIQTAALRDNAIQSLNVASLIAAKQGKVATATTLINQAVTAKYGPIEAEQKALLDNLALIKNDPNTSIQDKQRADQQTQLINAQAAQLAIDKQNTLDAQTEALKYAPVANASQLQQLQQAKSPAEVASIAASMGLQQPNAGRYKDTITTTTNPDGSQTQTVRVFDTITGKFVGGPGASAASYNAGGGTGAGAGGSGASGVSSGLSFAQYGKIANTDFNPSSSLDKSAQTYLDQYIKNGAIPSARSFAPGAKAGYVADVQNRAAALYFQATGQPLPTPDIIKGYQTQLIGNNKLLNNLNVQEGTVGKNASLLLSNINANDINQNNPVLNNWIDSVKNMLGDPNVATFLAQNTTVGNELGSLLALKNAQGGTTVHDKLEAAGIINKSDSSAQIAAKVKVLLQEAVNSRGAIQDANKELYQQTDPLLQDSNNPGRQQAQNSAFVEKALTSQGLHYDAVMQHLQQLAPQYPGQQPAIDPKSGKVGFATPDEIQNGTAIPL